MAKEKDETIRDIIKNPSRRGCKCRRCSGRGRINLTGMISSDVCPDCEEWSSGHARGTGRSTEPDHAATEQRIRKAFERELADKKKEK